MGAAESLMSTPNESLKAALEAALEGHVVSLVESLGEITVEVVPADWALVAQRCRDASGLRFDTAIDLCAVDYEGWGAGEREGPRFAVVLHLLSTQLNQRLRLRTFCVDDDYPLVASLVEVWPAVGWYEREAFDLMGVLFEGHPDLRRILTDYGFVGHPFRKDFPISGEVEMRYDPEQKRVIYQPVTIEPRENVPRVIREEGYGRG
jgi:NADH-quinone oxidoreductase subunit C